MMDFKDFYGKSFHIEHLKWDGSCLEVLDQRLLPDKIFWVSANNIEDVFNLIRKMYIRGAPLIGIVAAFGVVLKIKSDMPRDIAGLERQIDSAIEILSKSRPTAVNLHWALRRIKEVFNKNRDRNLIELIDIIENDALSIWKEDLEQSYRIGDLGSELIEDEDNVLTHCNAGGLATGGYGTALAVFFSAKERGKNFSVYVDETRPLLQGGRLTCWELKEAGIDYKLITDSMAGFLMKEKKIDKVFVGADRIVKNGDFANKIGTYSLARLAGIHKLPFYVVAPSTSFDLSLDRGEDIPIERRGSDEVLKISGVRVAPSGTRVENPAFDITESEFITAIITEKGIIERPFKERIKKVLNG
ncbi:MAG: S-methyl-5-thioribose-1-phosphate isomerase [Candidatus Kaelpia imicola]|nr:S-methyl-5-thioribose-1-phosphate isomerase [Candidatus Kaelpia imicola]